MRMVSEDAKIREKENVKTCRERLSYLLLLLCDLDAHLLFDKEARDSLVSLAWVESSENLQFNPKNARNQFDFLSVVAL